MPLHPLAAIALAILSTILTAGSSSAAPPEPVLPARQIAALEHWLDQNSPWPRKPTPPQFTLATPAQAQTLSGHAGRLGLTPRAYYDPESATITLITPFNPRDPYDVSVVLHELVHHRQHDAAHWYCPGAQEKSAYDLQSQWLSERGLPDRINWIAVILEAGCTPRDIHPD